MALYACAVFLSAFLLFLVEPLIGKAILPWFGGSAAVWSSCLLFFQSALLAGYGYAHASMQRFSLRRQGVIHCLLVLCSLLWLPIVPRQRWLALSAEHPSVAIVLLLTVTIGFPFILLSATSPLLQAWYSREAGGRSPYWLFAVSNGASLVALLAYPLAIEPVFSLHQQLVIWSVAYGAFVILIAASGIQAIRSDVARLPLPDLKAAFPLSRALVALWFLLAACGSALLLAITSHLSQNVAPIPFLWILPLAAYLISFIVCFAHIRLYHRAFFLRAWAVALGAMSYALAPVFANSRLILLIPLFCIGLLLCCIVLHGELARLKPAPEHLTTYYLVISAGGAVGAIFVALLAPAIFTGYFELEIALGASAVLALIALWRDPESFFYHAKFQPAWLFSVALVAALLVNLGMRVRLSGRGARFAGRNFYGTLRVIDTDINPERGKRELLNGTITHGIELLKPARLLEPTSYYGRSSGIGLVLDSFPADQQIQVGIVGLGAGTLAAYGRSGDRYTFFEINPLVVRVARAQFAFLAGCKAQLRIVQGDARLSLEAEPPHVFDVLAVDAFSGDSVPIHLLTLQALRLYMRELKPHGILALHISNRFMDLLPVVASGVAQLHEDALLVSSGEDTDKAVLRASWVLVGDELPEAVEDDGAPIEAKPGFRLWTDDYSNALRLLKF